MSHEGRMARGAAFWATRDREDNLPAGIGNNEAKMLDVNYFLENSKPVKAEVVITKPKKEEKEESE